MLLDEFIRTELEIDDIQDDVTSRLLEEKGAMPVKAVIRSKADGTFAGQSVAQALARLYPDRLILTLRKQDGDVLEKGEEILSLRGPLALCLGVERTLLNFLCHLSGVATLTRRYVTLAGPVKILPTRKTLPGLRELQLEAVRAGGGFVHRRSLSDGILIKENHQTFGKTETLLKNAFASKSPLHGVEIEVQNLADLERVLPHHPTVVLLDNFSLKDLEKAIPKIREASACAIEISGGVNLQTVKALADLKPDYISVGALTHSAPSLDLSLDIESAT